MPSPILSWYVGRNVQVASEIDGGKNSIVLDGDIAIVFKSEDDPEYYENAVFVVQRGMTLMTVSLTETEAVLHFGRRALNGEMRDMAYVAIKKGDYEIVDGRFESGTDYPDTPPDPSPLRVVEAPVSSNAPLAASLEAPATPGAENG